MERLQCCSTLKGTRGQSAADTNDYIHAMECVSHLLAEHNEIKELDFNPIRIFPQVAGVMALEARMKIDRT